ncbi:uncharacterized protein LOC113521764 [Galleria mellonella]|uniref:Uncharacterized protein LOC113521764 n=1 Tax=Galleria mellonella TaxID=7137 RepID=A0A6J1X294_GALME|nr:uncharacterized protein LOC113521764 [Galleria mellonella]
MNVLGLRLTLTRKPCNRFLNILKNAKFTPNIAYYYATIDPIDAFTNDLIQRSKIVNRNNVFDLNSTSTRGFAEAESPYQDISKMTTEELDKVVLQLLSKNKDKHIEYLVLDCINNRKFIGGPTLKKLYRHYSLAGKPDIVMILQKYCSKVDPYINKRNGGFQHYLAKAQCFKGNSEKGLAILMDAYKNNEYLRTFYRSIFKELIHDSVLNRSEASLVIFKRYVLEVSKIWDDHYPLVCFWHICWSSTWFSDQMLSNDLLECSEMLQKIVQDKATAFTISILKQEYNEDAVMRLLQTLLKYKMMSEYVKVLQILFNYKLRNRDLRGCTEIIRNCDALGVKLPADQQGRYIKMLIEGKQPDPRQPTKKHTSNYFKLKF